MTYSEIKNQQPELDECFFAFSNEQFKKGIEEKNLQDKKIFEAGAGLYGTNDGLEKLISFYENLRNKIAIECDPQEVYNYEYVNHECSYVGDDKEAILIVIQIYGVRIAGTIQRKFAYYQLN